MAQHAGASRFVWNALLDDAKGGYDAFCQYSPYVPDDKPPPVNYLLFAKQFQMLQARTPWLQGLSSVICRYPAKRLAVAYSAAFARAKKGDKLGLPRFHGKGNDSFTIPQDNAFKLGARGIYMQKIGWIRMRPNHGRGDSIVQGKPKMVIVKREAGKWFAYVQCKIDNYEPIVLAAEGTAAGIDMGVAKPATSVSLEGKTAIYDITPPKLESQMKRLEARRKRYQRAMSRKRDAALRENGWDGKPNMRKVAEVKLSKLREAQQVEAGKYHPRYSARYDIARRRAAKATRQLANFRHNSLHHIANELAAKHQVIILEKLQIKNMTRSAKGTAEEPGKNVRAKSGLNRGILQSGWGILRGMMTYKTQWRGGKVLTVPPQHTSQRCSQCGYTDAANRKTQVAFVCQKCGHGENADINAARNILMLGIKADDDFAHGVGAAVGKPTANAHGDCGVTRSAKCETPILQGATATGLLDKSDGDAGNVG